MIQEMKGPGVTLITLLHLDSKIELLKYADGSTGISRDGKHLGFWEPHECDDCCRTFAQYIAKTSNGRISLLHCVLKKDFHSSRHLCVN